MTSENNIKTQSLISCINMMEKIGFNTQFQANDLGIKSLTTQRIYKPDEVSIINFYQFEDIRPNQQCAILYAIESKNGERGTLIDFGGSAQDMQVTDFIKNVKSLRTHKND